MLGLIGLMKFRLIWLAITAGFFLALFCHKLGWQPSVLGHPINLVKTARLGMFFFTGGSYFLFRERISFRSWVACVVGGVLFLAMFHMNFAEIALACLDGYLLFYMAFLPITLLLPFQKAPDVSYGLYLYGWPIQKLMIWYFPALSVWLVVIFSLVCGLFVGLISWKLVEKPFLKLKSKSSKLET